MWVAVDSGIVPTQVLTALMQSQAVILTASVPTEHMGNNSGYNISEYIYRTLASLRPPF